ncbi:MAG: 50S ribosomal protein L23 [Patescibacteria group bacterium]
MSWLNLRKKETVPAAAPKTEAAAKKLVVTPKSAEPQRDEVHAAVLLRPHVTEKGADTEIGVYAFEVAQRANKRQIAAAIKGLYRVEPRKIAVVPITRKQTFVRGRKGAKGGGKKAYVHLKPGQKIDNL